MYGFIIAMLIFLKQKQVLENNCFHSFLNRILFKSGKNQYQNENKFTLVSSIFATLLYKLMFHKVWKKNINKKNKLKCWTLISVSDLN